MWDEVRNNIEASILYQQSELSYLPLIQSRYFLVGYYSGSIPPEFMGIWPLPHITAQPGPDYFLMDGSQERFPKLRFPTIKSFNLT